MSILITLIINMSSLFRRFNFCNIQSFNEIQLDIQLIPSLQNRFLGDIPAHNNSAIGAVVFHHTFHPHITLVSIILQSLTLSHTDTRYRYLRAHNGSDRGGDRDRRRRRFLWAFYHPESLPFVQSLQSLQSVRHGVPHCD